jgi:hypothetical protein
MLDLSINAGEKGGHSRNPQSEMIFLLKRMTIVLKKIQFLTRSIRSSVKLSYCLARKGKLTIHRPLKGSSIIMTRLHLFRQ